MKKLTGCSWLASGSKNRAHIKTKEEGFVAQVYLEGKEMMTPRICTAFTPFFDNMHYCGFLNNDEQVDFMLHFYCGGNGLNADFNEVTLLLSNENGYEATSVQTYGGGPYNHFVKIEGKPHFIMKSFGGISECLDGKILTFGLRLLEIKRMLTWLIKTIITSQNDMVHL